MNKKILIIYATAGIGHKKASVAVNKALEEIAPEGTEITIIDALDYTNAFFKWSYLEFYLLMVNKLPTLWGLAYYMTDNFYLNIIISKLRRFSNKINAKKLADYLVKTKPDVIISTHFFASEVISDMKASGVLTSKLITVITDYRLHSWWVADKTDMYVTGGEDAKNDLLKWKVDPSKIMVLGIPAEPVFSKALDRKAIFAREGFKEDVFTVLVIGGGFGVGPIESIVRVIKDIETPLQILVVCGHNDDLVKKVVDMKKGAKAHIKVLGFIDNVYEYMEIADILISKAGGITAAESLAKELPMIVIAPIVGQETRNADFLARHNAAFEIDDPNNLRALLEDLISHPEKMDQTKKAIGMIRKPAACYDIAKLALNIGEEE